MQMKKDDYIARHGEEAYELLLARNRNWHKANHERVISLNFEQQRKGGRNYEKKQIYNLSGLQGDRHKIRTKHGGMWRQYKRIIAPNSQLHHQWRQESVLFDGVALVERDQHMYGIINVIQILEGEITLFTEEEVRNRVN